MPTPAYDLHTLGWNSFQDLCHTISREVLGQTVQRFSDSNDGGRDGAFEGMWTTERQEDLSGPLVIQCKFTSKAHHNLKPSDIAPELDKVAGLVNAGKCTTYILMTNARISGRCAASVDASLRSVGVKYPLTLGSQWLRQQITENSQLRTLVPRVYGLGDLSQILDARANDQTRAILNSMQEDIKTVVLTNTYQHAVNALAQHNFVLLVGEPASGKTTIATLLTIAALDRWHNQTFKLESPSKLQEHWNPHEPAQFFWIDDAFGVTQYEESRVRDWNYVLPRLQPMLNSGARILMTSRDYIYNRARDDLKSSSFPMLNESQVVVDVRKLSIRERRQILYNHIRLGNQSNFFKREIKPHLEGIAKSPQFKPEIARRLGHKSFTKDLSLDEHSLRRFVDKPDHLLRDIIRGLDAHSRAALSLIYMRKGAVTTPLSLEPPEREALERLGSNPGSCIVALQALKGGMVRHSYESGDPSWQFRHPTVGDAMSKLLAENPDLIDILAKGSALRTLLSQITCGSVGIENALVLPSSMFQEFLDRLATASNSRMHPLLPLMERVSNQDVQYFLAARCSKSFLRHYLERNPNMVSQFWGFSAFRGYSSRVRLANRLCEFGLLPENIRLNIVDCVTELALCEDDFWEVEVGALSEATGRYLFRQDERHALAGQLKEKVLPLIDDVRSDWESDHDSSFAAGDFMEPLVSYCQSLESFLEDDTEALSEIADQKWRMEDWIGENSPEAADDDWDRPLDPPELDGNEVERSIFDDIDADDDTKDD